MVLKEETAFYTLTSTEGKTTITYTTVLKGAAALKEEKVSPLMLIKRSSVFDIYGQDIYGKLKVLSIK